MRSLTGASRRFLVGAIIASLGSAAAVVGWAWHQPIARLQEREPAIVKPVGNVFLRTSLFPYLWGAPEADTGGVVALQIPRRASDRPLLLILFQYTDCVSGLADLDRWTAMHREISLDVDVVGVTTGGEPLMLTYFVESHGVSFPVVLDQDRVVFDFAATIGLRITPAMVLLHPEGNVLAVSRTARVSESEIRSFASTVQRGTPPLK